MTETKQIPDENQRKLFNLVRRNNLTTGEWLQAVELLTNYVIPFALYPKHDANNAMHRLHVRVDELAKEEGVELP